MESPGGESRYFEIRADHFVALQGEIKRETAPAGSHLQGLLAGRIMVQKTLAKEEEFRPVGDVPADDRVNEPSVHPYCEPLLEKRYFRDEAR
jgi:hypothetical protein